MERLMVEALRRTRALDGLASYAGERAIFTGSAPADVEFGGAGYPYCALDWWPVSARPRIGALEVSVIALDEGELVPGAVASALRAELDGMVFGGECARALHWKATREYAGAQANRTPRICGATLEFEAYEYTAPLDGLELALSRAVGALLGAGYAQVHLADPAGELMEGVPYCVQLTSLTRQKAAPGYEWCSFEAALRLPGASREQVCRAQGRLGATGVLALGEGAAIVDSVRALLTADGYAQGQIQLRGRVNALELDVNCAALDSVQLTGAIRLSIAGTDARTSGGS